MTPTTRPSVVYVLPDKVGGSMNLVANLLQYRKPDGFGTEVLLTHNHLNTDTRFAQPLPCDRQTTFEYTLPIENLHTVLRRLARMVPPGPGVIVAGDLLDLAMLSVYDVGRAVVLILHGDDTYYYDLALKHDAVVHAYVVASRKMHRRLLELLPHRASTIFRLPYGILVPEQVRRPVAGPLRLIFAGRLDLYKGVLDLPAIDAGLRARGVERTWTIVGGGPEEAAMRAAWSGAPGVEFTGPLTHAATIARLAEHDVFVLPTRTEGFPVSLLEAMGAGAVPVVSHIESGVPDLVDPGVTGLLPAPGDVEGFVDAIAQLALNRALLDGMSARCRTLIETEYDIRVRVAAYQALYARYEELYRPLSIEARLQYGSRLDRRWLPNSLVRLVRTAVRASR
jgi:glycosyltransferase involved in cell wall biosynthesis